MSNFTTVWKVWSSRHKRYVGNEMRPYGKEKIWWEYDLLTRSIYKFKQFYGPDCFGPYEIHVFNLQLIGKEFMI